MRRVMPTPSKQESEAIIGREISDDDFRIILLADPNLSLAWYDLAKKPASVLSADDEGFDAISENLSLHLPKSVCPINAAFLS